MTAVDATRRTARARVAARAVALVLLWAGPAAAQAINGQGGQEIQQLREAALRESAGDLESAERILRSVLEARPTSLSALLSLERVLRMQGRVEEIIPPIERVLAEDPSSVVAHQMRVRTYSTLDALPELERAAEAWIRAMPRVETPYREIARVWEARGDYKQAIRVLERGRSRVGRKDALALELGDVYARAGDLDRAVREWDRAIGPTARGFSLVRRRLAMLPDGGASVLPSLIDALMRSSPTLERRRAAAELAIDAGLANRAEEIAKAVAADLPPDERQGFLVEVARRAEGGHLYRLAYWAYSELLTYDGPANQMLAVRSRVAELALTLGDTASARENYLALEKAFDADSPERRQATAFRIELTAREGDLDKAIQEFAEFQRSFKEAPELDRLAASLADLLLRRGDVDRAEEVLGRLSGPRTSLVRSHIALRRGDVTAARAALLAAAPALHGEEATETIGLATLLGRVSPAGAELLSRAMTELALGRTQDAVAILWAESGGLNSVERPAILEFAARLADRSELETEAERIRRAIITDHPQAPEAPAALLALAYAVSARDPDAPEARELLERLILEHPRSALVPQARRELNRLQGRIPNS